MMKNLFFGTLLTVIAAGVGGFVGFLIGMPLACFTGDAFFYVLVYGMPGAFSVLGVAFAWWALLRKPGTLKHALRPNECLNCGYDLRGNTTGRCPECNAGIAKGQRRHLGLNDSNA